MLDRDAPVAMNGEATPASPSAPTPFKKSRRPILVAGLACPVGNAKRAEVGEMLVSDRAWVTRDCFFLGFMVRFSPFFLAWQVSNVLTIRHNRSSRSNKVRSGMVEKVSLPTSAPASSAPL